MSTTAVEEPERRTVKLGTVLRSTNTTATALKTHETTDIAGQRDFSFKIRVCALTSGLSVSQEPWGLVGSDGGIYSTDDGTYNGGDLPEPTYPAQPHDLPKGQCVPGWITLGLPKSSKIVAVTYTPTDEDGNALAYWRWTVTR